MSDWSNTGASPPGPNINPDKYLKRSTKPRVLEVRFGDGYSQRMRDGVNTINESWDLQFTNRPITDIRTVLAFLESRGGVTSFTWTPPGNIAQTTKSLTATASSGGKIQVTSASHGLKNGMKVVIYGANGTVPVNGNWFVESVATNTFVLSGSTFSGSGTTSGTILIPDMTVVCREWSTDTVFVESDYITVFASLSCTFERVYE